MIVKNRQDLIEGLIDELTDEKSESIRIAKSYKQQLDKYQISNDDIDSLHKTIKRIFEILKRSTKLNDNDEKAMNSLLKLLNSDTLKSLHNYKAAIGVPLTQVTANFIRYKLLIG